ncbi:MAG: hypothetical protein R3181_11660 [Rubricoccaceae bacterium]|nr:hypothetical protein [Rubricoccaceae bacterium]
MRDEARWTSGAGRDPWSAWLRRNALQLLMAGLLGVGTYVATEVLDQVHALQADVRVLLTDRTALQGELRALRRDVDRNERRIVGGCE